MHTEPTSIDPSASLPHAHIQAIRRALANAASVAKNTNAGIAAMKAAHTAYRLCFTQEEQSAVVVSARQRILQAPPGHWLHGHEIPDSFDAVVSLLGTSAIREALGDDA